MSTDSSASYCRVSALSGWVRMSLKSSCDKAVERHVHREAALQLGNQIRHLGDMERARGDEEHEVRFHRAVLGVHGGAFHDGQNVALHALAADVRPAVAATSGPRSCRFRR